MTTRPALANSVHLDAVRGLAALVVFFSHLRIVFFVDYSEVESPTSVARAFYFLTGFSHQAVLAFFVLSGFFIASTIERQLDSWSWRTYAIDRVVRLYAVLVPCLLLTAAFDSFGRAADGPAYRQPLYSNTMEYRPADALTVFGLFANLSFLQTVVAPPFGSNSPLWSLANEFWYYAIFPLVLLAVSGRRSLASRVAYLVAGVGLLVLLPPIRALFPVWLMGAAIAKLPPREFFRRRACTVFSVALALGLATAERLGAESPAADLAVGFAFALALYTLLHRVTPARIGTYRTIARELAGCSFTLYAVHLPIFFVARAVGFGGLRIQPDAILELAAVASGTLAFAWGLARFTEGHTDRARRWFHGLRKEKSDGRYEGPGSRIVRRIAP